MITVYEPDSEPRVRRVRLPSRPPFTYVLDPFVPLWPERVDGWFGFNNLACARGLLARRLGRADTVVYWAVDFVPEPVRRQLPHPRLRPARRPLLPLCGRPLRAV